MTKPSERRRQEMAARADEPPMPLEPGTDADRLLQALLAAIRRFVRTPTVDPSVVLGATRVLVIGAPVTLVSVRHFDMHGREVAAYRRRGDTALSEALGAFVTAGLNEALEAPVRRRVAALLGAGIATLAVDVGLEEGAAVAHLVHQGDESVWLFALATQVTAH